MSDHLKNESHKTNDLWPVLHDFDYYIIIHQLSIIGTIPVLITYHSPNLFLIGPFLHSEIFKTFELGWRTGDILSSLYSLADLFQSLMKFK